MTTPTETEKRVLIAKPLPCPFCGELPGIFPLNPEEEGTCVGQVKCVNNECPAQPSVDDGETLNDERGSDAYKAIAIARWNRRA